MFPNNTKKYLSFNNTDIQARPNFLKKSDNRKEQLVPKWI